MHPRWSRHTSDFDEDTIRFLSIVQHFLVQYFGHDNDSAEKAMDLFMAALEWEEDLYHHEGAYRVAAMIRYFCDHDGDCRDHMEWLHKSGHNHTPEEARKYFWQHYLTQPSTKDDGK